MTLLLSESDQAFLTRNQVATLTTVRPDGTPHVVPVRFTWDPTAGLARVMTVGSRRKARNLTGEGSRRAVLCQVSGFYWLTIEGDAVVTADPVRVQEGVDAYFERYGSPPPIQPGLVVIEIAADRVMGTEMSRF